MENVEVYNLTISIFVCYCFIFAQVSRAAIKRNETVKAIPIFCILFKIYRRQ